MNTYVTNPKAEFKDLAMYRMYADAPDTPNMRSVLKWGVRESNPRITVNTNVPSDKNNRYGMITAAFNPETFMILLEQIEEIARGENGQKIKFDCLTTIKKEDGSRTEPFLSSEVIIGKDDKGLVWISVLAKDRPKIRFVFQISDFHKIYKTGGVAINESEASVLQATAVSRSLKGIFTGLTGTIAPKFEGKNKPITRETKPLEAESSLFEDIEI